MGAELEQSRPCLSAEHRQLRGASAIPCQPVHAGDTGDVLRYVKRGHEKHIAMTTTGNRWVGLQNQATRAYRLHLFK